MGEAEALPERKPRGRVALGFAIAALAASWNPVAAPFGVMVGIAAALLAARALRRAGERRRVPAAALAVAVVATLASVVVLLLTAGAVGVELPGEPVVKGRTQAELDQLLSEAAERTRAQRESAVKELERLAPASPTRPAGAARRDGGTARDAGSGAAP